MKTEENIAVIAQSPTAAFEDNSWGEEAERTGVRKWFMPALVTVVSLVAFYSIGSKLLKTDGSGVKSVTSATMVDLVKELPAMPTPTPPPPKPAEEIQEPQETPTDPDEPTITPPDPGIPTFPGGPGIRLPGGNGPFVPRRPGSVISQAQRDFGAKVAETIEQALRRHPIAKTAAGVAPKVRASVSADGRITGLVLESSTGNPALDKIISEELNNLRTPSIAPEGTKFITVRISLRRPN